LLPGRVELPTGYGGDGLGVPSRVGPPDSGVVNKGLWVELGDTAEMGEVGMPPPDIVSPVIMVLKAVPPGSLVLFNRGYGVAWEVLGVAVEGGICAVVLNSVSAELIGFVVMLGVGDVISRLL